MAVILVVDDIPFNLNLLKMYLEDEGHRVLVAENGRDCLEIIRKSHPDLVLLDIAMPEIDGYEVLLRLRHSQRHSHLPVIMLTADNQDASLTRCLEAGANDYITKPFTVQAVSARIARALRESQERLRLERYNEQLMAISARQTLTRVLSRDAFMERCREEMKRALKSRSMLALAYVSIDDFPTMAKKLDPALVDDVLVQFGALLRRVFRPNDLVGHLGGEEFLVCMVNTHALHAMGAVERLGKNLSNLPRRRVATDLPLTASVGVALLHNQISPEALLEAAADALLRARAQGRGQVMFAQAAV